MTADDQRPPAEDASRRRLLVAQNITPVFRLEQARRHFIADVSHELRTPITVFRGYLEALRDAARGGALRPEPLREPVTFGVTARQPCQDPLRHAPSGSGAATPITGQRPSMLKG